METGNILELPWEEQPKPEKKPAPRAVMSEEQMQAVEAAWKKKWSREEASISGSTPKSTPTKSARMKMTMARKSAPTTGGVKPEANDSPASFRSQKPTARRMAPSTGGLRLEEVDSPSSTIANKLKSTKKITKSLSTVSDTRMQDTPAAKTDAVVKEHRQRGRRRTAAREPTRYLRLMLYCSCTETTATTHASVWTEPAKTGHQQRYCHVQNVGNHTNQR